LIFSCASNAYLCQSCVGEIGAQKNGWNETQLARRFDPPDQCSDFLPSLYFFVPDVRRLRSRGFDPYAGCRPFEENFATEAVELRGASACLDPDFAGWFDQTRAFNQPPEILLV